MSEKDLKIVMICESHSDFIINKDGKDYILEGIFAELGVENANGRIYEEKEYLPHLEYLQKRIKKGNLVGELDHPEKFDISLQKVSHIIEDLKYNPDKRQVIGRIRLLNTDAGKNAKAMIDDGVKLSISSRAAGIVKENKKVQIKKIFTYDLVAEPGFENAQLNLINDSLGLDEESSLRIYEMKNISPEMLSWLIDDNSFEKNITEALNLENKNNSNMMTENKNINNNSNEFVTIAQMDAYSEIIKEKIDSLEKIILDKNLEINELKAELDKHKVYSNYLADQIDEKEKNIQLINEEVKNVIEFANYIVEHTDNLIEFGNTIVERTNQIQEYSEYLSEHLDNTITETQNIIKFADYIGEKTDLGIQYTEHVAENLKLLGEHSDYLVEHLNNLISYADYSADKLNTTIEYAEQIAKTVNENLSLDTNHKEINEKLNINNITNTKTLSSKIDAILESVKKQNVNSTSQKIGFFGFNLIGEEKQREFALLDDDQKQRIIKAVNEAKPVTAEHFLQIWESALHPTESDKIMENIIAEMPTEYKPIWEKLDDETKYHIIQQASLYKMQTPYQIKNFWQTRPILNQALSLQKLNEDLTADKIKAKTETETETSLNENQVKNGNMFAGFIASYNNDHITSIGNAIKKF